MYNLMKFIAAISFVGLVGCATAPKSVEERADLESDARDLLAEMQSRDPSLAATLDQSAGYAVFPSIGKGAMIVGGAHGRGVLYERGRMVGYLQINEASIGAQIGGQQFSELIVFHTPEALADVKRNDFELAGNASAVAITEGAAASAQFDEGVSVFVLPRGGLMADISIGGQQINFTPRG